MATLDALYKDVVSLYRGWQSLESSGVYADGQPVLDHDYAPASPSVAFSTRRDVLEAVVDLCAQLHQAPGVCKDVLDNLAASEVVLRSRLGEHIPFSEYVRQQYLYQPSSIPQATLDRVTSDVRRLCTQFDLTYEAGSRPRYLERFRVETAEEVVRIARDSQVMWLELLYRHVRRPELLDVALVIVNEDEPWSFFLSGGSQVTFSINAHPRHTFTRGQCQYVTSHEVAGHAVQNALWAEAVTRDGLPEALLVRTTHHPVTALAEGLAQALPYFLCLPEDLEPEMMLAKRLRELRDMTLANAQLMLEGGAPIRAAWRYCADRLFFVTPFEWERDLADRSLRPTQRAYLHCYAPALLAFMGVAERLPRHEIDGFLRSHYEHIPSPRMFWNSG